MDVQDVLVQVREQIGPKHVFGEPIREGETVMVPVARVRGGGGGGGNGVEGKPGGQGVGFGMTAIPTGAFVFREGKLSWRPALDLNRVIMGAQFVAAIALMTFGSLFRARMRRRLPWR
ncbi:MAG: spore germination protein GerW family protein [Myxococcales bacterium]